MDKPVIAIVDYGMGNLLSVKKAFDFLKLEAYIATQNNQIDNASHVVLPGVGAFGDCMDNLKQRNLIEPILGFVESGRPFLGICLGLQILFSASEEFGSRAGLDIVPGQVVKFTQDNKNNGSSQKQKLKIPHMGWNSIRIKKDDPLLKGVSDGSCFYFVHSYFVRPEDDSVALTTTSYGVDFVSSVSLNNVWGCQFHPEKSQKNGLQVLKNFGELSS